jgi:hypothetical protein
MPPAPAPAKKPPARAPAPAKPARRLAVVPTDPRALLAQQVDELGRLEKEMVTIRPKLVRIETLRGLIRKHYEDEPAAKAFETRGAEFLATLGPRAYERSIDCAQLAKEIGLKAYATIARPTLKVVEETCAPDVVARVIKQDYVGARPLKTFALNNSGK